MTLDELLKAGDVKPKDSMLDISNHIGGLNLILQLADENLMAGDLLNFYAYAYGVISDKYFHAYDHIYSNNGEEVDGLWIVKYNPCSGCHRCEYRTIMWKRGDKLYAFGDKEPISLNDGYELERYIFTNDVRKEDVV
jgi:hypothetical protein